MEKKEAMKILKDFHDKSALFSVRTALDVIIPELRESEDEKIRQKFIKLVKMSNEVGGFALHKWEADEMLAWLEKQGEQNPYGQRKECLDCQFNYASECKGSCAMKRSEQKSQRMISAEAKEALYDKPTDEEMKESLRTEYEKGRADTIAEMEKEWSEEDEKMLEGIVNTVKDVRCQSLLSEIEIYDDYIDWLKSLKDRYTWRPSSEQIDTLEHFIRSIGESGYASPYDNNTKLLYSLLEQLKKLKA